MPEPVRLDPMDRHNELLLANAHPADWTNPVPAERYNLVVIGAGTAGLVAAAGAAGIGAKVALVERHLLGGDCLNVGCVPSKAMIRCARAARDVRSAGEFGVKVNGTVEVDFAAVMERMRRLRAGISPHDSAARFRDLGVDVFLGHGRFAGRDAVRVGDAVLRFSKAVIATGARAVRPPIDGIDEVGFLTNETVFSLTELPRRLAVFGAGPLGCEMAQTFRRLGSEVWIIERQGQLLSREDPDAARIIADSFERDGIKRLLNTEVTRAEKTPEGKRLRLVADGRDDSLVVDELLIGAGRAPNVEDLGLEEAGVKFDPRRGVTIDEHLRTENPNIYAAGDICLKYKFTHTADATARLVIQNALFWGRKKQSALTIPWCTYTDPEIAHVGMYEKDAKERGIETDTFVQRFDDVDRAVLDGEPEGMVKIHVAKGGDRILGGTIVARHAGEMISEITLAMVGGLGLRTISATIHPYPTQASAIRMAADQYNRTRLTPFVKGIMERLLAWRR
jgi:pyruvate/2-oxoglutarate dehydrogenase complex dihydrolipoamide dehydrogenase (E3) component